MSPHANMKSVQSRETDQDEQKEKERESVRSGFTFKKHWTEFETVIFFKSAFQRNKSA